MRILVVLLSTCLFGQELSVGFIGGFNPRSDFQNNIGFPAGSPGFTNYSTPKRYIVGAMVEYRFSPRFSLEADGLYHPLEYTFAGIEPDGSLNSISPATVVTWEFPVLAKYRFLFHRASPFIEAGPSFRTTGNLNEANPSHVGIVAGIGVETHVRGFKIAPTIRYTRWERDPTHFLQTVPDQLEFLIAFSAESRSNWHPMGSRITIGGIMGVDALPDYRSSTGSATILPVDGSTPRSVQFLQSSGPRSPQGGAMFELRIAGNLSVEGNIIYERVKGFSQTRISATPTAGTFLPPSDFAFSGPEWKFPVLAKYRVPVRRIALIVELGPSFRIPPGASSMSHHGVTGGLGFETRWKKVRFSPVARYTRWGAESSDFSRGNLNQLDLLTAVSF